MPKDGTKLLNWKEKDFHKKVICCLTNILFSSSPSCILKKAISLFPEANFQKIRQINKDNNQTNETKNLPQKTPWENKVNKTKWCAMVRSSFYVLPAFQQHPSHVSADLTCKLEQHRLSLGTLHSGPIGTSGTPATRFPLPLHLTWQILCGFLHLHSFLYAKQLNPFPLCSRERAASTITIK